jgi:hypothetical protein
MGSMLYNLLQKKLPTFIITNSGQQVNNKFVVLPE